MSYSNSNCYVQSCTQNCCDASGYCPTGGSTCYYYYSNNSTTTNTSSNVGQPIGYGVAGLIFLILIICGIKRYIQKKRLRQSQGKVQANQTILNQTQANFNGMNQQGSYGMQAYPPMNPQMQSFYPPPIYPNQIQMGLFNQPPTMFNASQPMVYNQPNMGQATIIM